MSHTTNPNWKRMSKQNLKARMNALYTGIHVKRRLSESSIGRYSAKRLINHLDRISSQSFGRTFRVDATSVYAYCPDQGAYLWYCSANDKENLKRAIKAVYFCDDYPVRGGVLCALLPPERG